MRIEISKLQEKEYVVRYEHGSTDGSFVCDYMTLANIMERLLLAKLIDKAVIEIVKSEDYELEALDILLD